MFWNQKDGQPELTEVGRGFYAILIFLSRFYK